MSAYLKHTSRRIYLKVLIYFNYVRIEQGRGGVQRKVALTKKISNKIKGPWRLGVAKG